MMVTAERAGARTIEAERNLAALRCDLGADRRMTWEERQQLTLSHLRRLRAAKNEAGKCERPGFTTQAIAAHDARYDVQVLRRYLDLIAAERRCQNVARGWGAVTGRGISPTRAAYYTRR